LSGTKSSWEPRYFDEIVALAKTKPNVVVNTEYNTMGEYVAASDAVVLFYEDVFQSAVVTQAVWAGLPCIFSEAEGFAPYHAAGPVVRSEDELAKAMREIQKPETPLLLQPDRLAGEGGRAAVAAPRTAVLVESARREGKTYDAILFPPSTDEPTAAGRPRPPERAGLVSTKRRSTRLSPRRVA